MGRAATSAWLGCSLGELERAPDHRKEPSVSLGAVLMAAAIAGASALVGARTRDRFWLGLSVVIVGVGVVIGIRYGIDTTHVIGSVDDLFFIVGGLLAAGSIVVLGGLPRSLEARLRFGSALPEWEFDRSLAEARQPFVAAAGIDDVDLAEKAQWRNRVTRPPPTAAWAALAERLEAVDRAWVELRERDHALTWTAQSDQIAAEWANLRAPLLARRDVRRRLLRRFERISMGLTVALILAGTFRVPTGLANLPSAGRAPIVPTPLPGRTVTFLPLGSFPIADLERLTAYYQTRYGLEIDILPPIQVPAGLEDPNRKQLAAEDLINVIAIGIPEASDPDRVVIGFVTDDIYIRGRPDWRWAFGLRDEGHLGVVSTARMGAPPGLFSDLVESARLRKMVTRDIGVLYFGLPLSTDPHSVLYRSVLGVGDLDAMGEDY